MDNKCRHCKKKTQSFSIFGGNALEQLALFWKKMGNIISDGIGFKIPVIPELYIFIYVVGIPF